MRPRRPSTISLKLMAIVVVRKKMIRMVCVCVCVGGMKMKESRRGSDY